MADYPASAIWLTLLLAGALTFLIRLSFIALLGRYSPPPLLRRALRFVPPAVLSAIIFPELLVANGQIAFGWHNYRLLAGIVAILVAWRSRSALLTIAVGMAALWLLQLLG